MSRLGGQPCFVQSGSKTKEGREFFEDQRKNGKIRFIFVVHKII